MAKLNPKAVLKPAVSLFLICLIVTAMLAMGIIREFFGTGAVFGVPIFQGVIDPIIVFILPPGGFFVFGMLIALANKLSGSKKKPEEIGCAACPMNGTCSKLQEKEACDK